MSPLERLQAASASVRPRTRRGAILATVAILGSAAALSVAMFAGAAMAWNPYLTYNLDREANARGWSSFELEFAGSAACAECHEPQAVTVREEAHAGVSCEACHSALGVHVEEAEVAGAGPAFALRALEEPGDEACIRCHTDAVGRPATMPTVDLYQHYKPVCLDCHDPHTSDAVRPPEVMHPLADLPACITCHGQDAFKARNVRHPDEATDDPVCLECHAKGRGPDTSR